MTNRKK